VSKSRFSRMVLPAILAAGLVVGGCREQPPVPDTHQRPDGSVQPEPTSADAAGDKLAAEPPQPDPPPPTEPPEPADPFHLTFELSSPQQKQRGWLRVLEFFNEGRAAKVEARWEGANRITVSTQNVRNLSLDLGQLPVKAGKSLVLRLNGQGIQLSSKHGPVVEFERGEAGNWRLRRE